MFGGGHMDQMVRSIKMNRELLGKSKGIYSEKYRKLRKEYRQKADRIHPGQPLSKSEKAKIKLEIRQDHIKANVKKVFLTIKIFSIVILLIALVVQSEIIENTIANSYEEDKHNNEQAFYKSFLKGKEALHERSYSEAVYLFQQSLRHIPKHEEAELWLAKTYFYWSHSNKRVYRRGKNIVDSLALKHPDNLHFQDLKKNFPTSMKN